MFFASIISDYFIWHYTRAPWEMWGVWRNMLWFVGHYFSLGPLTRSLFAPFKRITEGRGETFSFEDLGEFIIINLFSRLIGALVRLTIIGLGLMVLCATVVAGFLVYLFWVIAPFSIVGLIGAGISMLLI